MKIDHIGIATESLVEGLAVWRNILGLEPEATEEVAEQGVRVAMLPIGDTKVELLEALNPDSPIARFLMKRGPGIHHIAVAVEDIQSTMLNLKNSGVRLIDETPRIGAGGCLVAFAHPSSTGGVLLELVQH
ncbi:MAG: methylmalonyl-CoA epimerase [Pyrinomonadaceae bacterium]